MNFPMRFASCFLSLLIPVALSGCVTDTAVRQQAFLERFNAYAPHAQFKEIRKVVDSPFYELVVDGTDILYVTEDGRYALSGELVDLKAQRSLRAERAREIVRSEIADVEEKYMLRYGPEDARQTVTVFVDLACPYCEKFVKDLPRLTERGIRFRLLFAPNGEVHAEPFRRAVALWCSPDPAGGLARAFRKPVTVKPQDACPSPVFASRELARRIGVRQTPAFVLEDGLVLFGYLGSDHLLRRLGIRGNAMSPALRVPSDGESAIRGANPPG